MESYCLVHAFKCWDTHCISRENNGDPVELLVHLSMPLYWESSQFGKHSLERFTSWHSALEVWKPTFFFWGIYVHHISHCDLASLPSSFPSAHWPRGFTHSALALFTECIVFFRWIQGVLRLDEVEKRNTDKAFYECQQCKARDSQWSVYSEAVDHPRTWKIMAITVVAPTMTIVISHSGPV